MKYSPKVIIPILIVVIIILLVLKKTSIIGSFSESEPVSNISKSTNAQSYEKSTNSKTINSKVEESIDGIYTYRDNSVEFIITIRGDNFSSKTMIITGFGSGYDSQNAQYDNGIINGNDLYDSSGMVKLGYVRGESLTTSIAGQRVTLSKQ